MIGDSITDCERNRPIGEGKGDALGRGYVTQIQALLQTTYPELNVRMINMGIAGNTVRELKARWQSDVLDLEPDWVSVMIGINDIARHFNRRHIKESHISIEEFEETLNDLVAEALRHGVREMILMTPFYIENNPNDPILMMVRQYGSAVRRISERHNTRFVDVQSAFDRFLDFHYSLEVSADRIHPTQAGHMVITREWLKSLNYCWD